MRSMKEGKQVSMLFREKRKPEETQKGRKRNWLAVKRCLAFSLEFPDLCFSLGALSMSNGLRRSPNEFST